MVRVMLVDDEICYLEKLRQILQNNGYEICGVYTDAFTALEALERSPPGILIADVLMPGMSGIGLARQVKRLYPEVRIVLMFEKLGFAVEGFELGIAGVILKPLTEKGVMKTLGRIDKQLDNT